MWSKFLLTLSMIGLLVFAIYLEYQKKKLKDNGTGSFVGFLKNPPFMGLCLIFFIALSGAFSIGDAEFWSERVRIRLPFLILPYAMYMMPRLTDRQWKRILDFLLIIIYSSVVWVLGRYFSNREEIVSNMSMGQPMPTPVEHIRYSLLVSWTLLMSVIFVLRQKDISAVWFRIYVANIFVLFVFVHFLAVRSGIVSLYMGLLALGLHQLFYYRNSAKKIMVTIAAGILLVVGSLYFFPTIQEKIEYSVRDIEQWKQGNAKNFSDGERLQSIEAGLKIGQRNLWTGVGTANLKDSVEHYYKENYESTQMSKLPHNQFVWIFASNGLVGLIFFVICIFLPLFYAQNYKDSYLWTFYAVMLSSFMVEATLETAVGTAFSLFFVLLLLRQLPRRTI